MDCWQRFPSKRRCNLTELQSVTSEEREVLKYDVRDKWRDWKNGICQKFLHEESANINETSVLQQTVNITGSVKS
jgi:hypothetical protein